MFVASGLFPHMSCQGGNWLDMMKSLMNSTDYSDLDAFRWWGDR